MEQSIQITRVRRINKDAKGNAINIVVIDLANGKPSIIRNSAQFVQDAKNSFLVGDNVTSINHPAISRVLKGMKRGMVSGDISHNKKGDMWVVTEDSSVITNKNHPQYNKVSVGDELPYQEDNTRVEGFLDIELNDRTEERMANAEALADATVASRGVFDVLAEPALELAEPVSIPTSIIDDVVGATIIEESAPSTKEKKK